MLQKKKKILSLAATSMILLGGCTGGCQLFSKESGKEASRADINYQEASKNKNKKKFSKSNKENISENKSSKNTQKKNQKNIIEENDEKLSIAKIIEIYKGDRLDTLRVLNQFKESRLTSSVLKENPLLDQSMQLTEVQLNQIEQQIAKITESLSDDLPQKNADNEPNQLMSESPILVKNKNETKHSEPSQPVDPAPISKVNEGPTVLPTSTTDLTVVSIATNESLKPLEENISPRIEKTIDEESHDKTLSESLEIKKVKKTLNSIIPQPSDVIKHNPELLIGNVSTIAEGHPGSLDEDVEISYDQNGNEISRKVISSSIKEEAIPNIIEKGTKAGLIEDNAYHTILEIVEEILPKPEPLIRYNPEAEVGIDKIISEGEEGLLSKTYEKVVDKDNNEISRKIIAEKVIKESQADVIEKGTKTTSTENVRQSNGGGSVETDTTLANGSLKTEKEQLNKEGESEIALNNQSGSDKDIVEDITPTESNNNQATDINGHASSNVVNEEVLSPDK
ncbi:MULTISPECIES: G5 domain-containing protein [unclassified Aerococcus]|uniref:G5 domain-containing protein n=1 Tax=unclassified Aerococcus TaxID=2618060 RepID=UPI0008A54F21|nr:MULTISPECIES: G5 domain-containing protein [unclassified Aerococcus]MDK6679191.1 G5 domain-containing protein [Aerococcus sp. UMB8608]MDK6685967.1 G5 domain-containing protein [Aerococcus sp. UMB8623]MDK6940772.1 G5 domain-containing protein [Aerococcus sp. UMB8487]OFK21378.1 hypothetical protein HMPREF2829_03685 [Aerococcus sp. HMSC072A12]OFR32588.1 hypothetical protein HMPREF2892_08220 [Aerococcus sp. HMSC061A03]